MFRGGLAGVIAPPNYILSFVCIMTAVTLSCGEKTGEWRAHGGVCPCIPFCDAWRIAPVLREQLSGIIRTVIMLSSSCDS